MMKIKLVDLFKLVTISMVLSSLSLLGACAAPENEVPDGGVEPDSSITVPEESDGTTDDGMTDDATTDDGTTDGGMTDDGMTDETETSDPDNVPMIEGSEDPEEIPGTETQIEGEPGETIEQPN